MHIKAIGKRWSVVRGPLSDRSLSPRLSTYCEWTEEVRMWLFHCSGWLKAEFVFLHVPGTQHGGSFGQCVPMLTYLVEMQVGSLSRLRSPSRVGLNEPN